MSSQNKISLHCFKIASVAIILSFTTSLALANANSCQNIFSKSGEIDPVQVRQEIEQLRQHLIKENFPQDGAGIRAKVVKIFVKTLPENFEDRFAFVAIMNDGMQPSFLASVNYWSSRESFAVDLHSELHISGALTSEIGFRNVFDPLIKYLETGKIENADFYKKFWNDYKVGLLKDVISRLKTSDGKEVSLTDLRLISKALSVAFVSIPPSAQVKLLNDVYGAQSPVRSISNFELVPVYVVVGDLLTYYRDRKEIGKLEKLLTALLE